MKGKSFEVVVGLFVVLVFGVFLWLATEMGKFSFNKKEVYTLYAPFDNIAGLDVNTKVKVAGVDIGFVRRVELKNGRAVVIISVYKKYKIPKDSTALIKSKSLLGDKFLEIKFGHSKQYLSNNDYITHTESSTDIGTLVKNINKVSGRLNDVVADNRATLKLAITQAKTAMEKFDKSMALIQDLVKENRMNIKDAVVNARESMEKLNRTLSTVSLMTANVKSGKGTLGQLITNQDLYDRLNSSSKSIKSISSKIDNGKGTLGKLVNDDAVYDNLHDTLKSINRYLRKTNRILVNVSVGNEYQFRHQDSKGYINADIYTMPDKFYRIGVVSEKDYKHSKDPSRDDNNKTRFTALMGKRYYDIVLRGGMIESTFGVGADYYTLNNNLQFSLDAYDFNHDNDIRDSNAQLKARISYKILRHFDIFGGVNEILNSKSRSAYAGVGMEFSNDDLKYMVGKVPVGSIK